MKSKIELVEMIYELYMAAFTAGGKCTDVAIGYARAKRKELLDAVKVLWDEMDDLARENEDLQDDINRMHELLADDTDELPDHHDAFDAMFPGCTPDDLPFPDVEDLTPASELLGGDE